MCVCVFLDLTPDEMSGVGKKFTVFYLYICYCHFFFEKYVTFLINTSRCLRSIMVVQLIRNE